MTALVRCAALATGPALVAGDWRRKLRATEWSRPGSECPDTRPAAARLAMIERIDRAPRRPVTVAPSFST